MPYKRREDLPAAVKVLPPHAQDIWRNAFNSAYEEYDGNEERAFAVAWAAVKRKYRKGEDGKWHKIDEGGKSMNAAELRAAIVEFNDRSTKGNDGLTWAERAERGAELAAKAAEILGGVWRYERGRVVEDVERAGLDAWAVGGPIKSLATDGEAVRVGGYAVVWGGPDKRDLTGEYFTPNTEELERVFKSLGKLPFLYRHAGDDTVKADVVGVVDFMARDDVGLWYEAQVTAADKYKKAILELIKAGKLGTSSGTFPRARRVSREGEILRWPIMEVSATPMPAEPRLGVELPVSVVKEHFAACGLSLDGVCDGGDNGEKPAAEGGAKETMETPAHETPADTNGFDMDAAKAWYRATLALIETITEE